LASKLALAKNSVGVLSNFNKASKFVGKRFKNLFGAFSKNGTKNLANSSDVLSQVKNGGFNNIDKYLVDSPAKTKIKNWLGQGCKIVDNRNIFEKLIFGIKASAVDICQFPNVNQWYDISAKFREIKLTKGNFGVGNANWSDADKIGKLWAGDGAILMSDGKGLRSLDGLKVYRFPAKKNNGLTQANLEWRGSNLDQYGTGGNAHITIIN
jgi:hypothetical protein